MSAPAATVLVEQWTPPPVADRAKVTDPGNRPIDKFRATAVGSVLAAGLLGLRDALEPPHDEEIAIVQDDSSGPPRNDPILLELDPDHPEESVVRCARGFAIRAERNNAPEPRVSATAAGPRARACSARALAGIGATPKPGPVGTASRPAPSTNGSVRSSAK